MLLPQSDTILIHQIIPEAPRMGRADSLFVALSTQASVNCLLSIPKTWFGWVRIIAFLFGISTDPVWVSIRLSFDDDESFKEAAVNLHFNNPQLASDPNDLNIPVMRVPVRSSGSISSTLPRTPRGVKDN